MLQPLESESKFSRDVIRQIFANIRVIHGFNQELLTSLEQRVSAPGEMVIGDIFTRLLPFLKMYTEYSNSYQSAVQLHVQTLKNNRTYASVAGGEIEKGLELPALLIMPIQRIPRYRMLLEDLLKSTEDSHPDHDPLMEAVNKIREVAEHINERIRETETSNQYLALPQGVRNLLQV